MQKWLTKRAVSAHVALLVLVPTFALLGRWQLHRALSGNGLSWAYTVEWPIFALYAVVLWWRIVHDQGEDNKVRLSPLGRRRAERRALADESADAELQRYNAYLASLHTRKTGPDENAPDAPTGRPDDLADIRYGRDKGGVMTQQVAQNAEQRARTEELARRTGASVYDLRVEHVVELSPGLGRLRVSGDGLTELSYEPGQDLMLAVSTQDGEVVRRRYTIRHLDRSSGLLDIDFSRHGDGPAARFLRHAKPGDRLEAIGPRGKIFLAEGVDWHLFAGDDAFLPAALAMAEALPKDAQAYLYLEVDGPEDQQPHAIEAKVEALEFVARDGGVPGKSTALLERLSRLDLPSGHGHAYIGGEHKMVTAMRDALVARGMEMEDCSPKSYWRIGVSNANHGEPPRE